MNILQSIYFNLQNGEGFSVNADVSSIDKLSVYTGGGYAVGGATGAPIIKNNEDLSWIQFTHAFARLVGLSKSIEGRCVIGGWVDESTSLAYLELSNVTQSLQKALDLANERGELAIFDFGNLEEIRIKR